MKKYKWVIILVNLVILLVVFNRSIMSKETILKEGKLIFLKLAPVDPRSLIQGDYMQLHYAISDSIFNFNRNINILEKNFIPERSILKHGYIVIQLDTNGIACKLRIQKDKSPIKEQEYLIKFTIGKRNINIGAESYFFEEGQSEKFEKSKYGGLKIDNEGNSILIGLFDEKFMKIE
ncbi:MAG: GDYXXLXY domain-containing protein [Bacteroidales bacterium]